MEDRKSWDNWTDGQRAEYREILRESYNALNALRIAGGLEPDLIPATLRD